MLENYEKTTAAAPTERHRNSMDGIKVALMERPVRLQLAVETERSTYCWCSLCR
jgi:hypothetical protein